MPTDDGALVAGEPHSAVDVVPGRTSTRATRRQYSFRVTRAARASRRSPTASCVGVQNRGGRSIWRWEAKEPMAAYLATATIGQFDISTRTVDGRPYVDAIDPDLLKRPKPRSGTRSYAVTGIAQPGYKRLQPDDRRPRRRRDARRSRVSRDTRAGRRLLRRRGAHRGRRRLDDAARRARPHHRRRRRSTAASVLEAHPFLAHYQTARTGRGCQAKGTTGTLAGARASERRSTSSWSVDLVALRRPQRRGRAQPTSATTAFQFSGVAVDDVVVTGARGLDVLRGRRRHARRLDGPGRPRRRAAQRERLDRRPRSREGPRTAGDVAAGARSRASRR